MHRNARMRSAVGSAALLRVLRLSRGKIGVTLVYHRVAEKAGDRRTELVPAIDARDFARQLTLVAGHFQPVQASELPIAVARRRRGGRIPIAVTFDDDISEHHSIVAPLLRARRVPATFFLTGAFLEPTASFWWDDLQKAIDARAVAADDLKPLDPSAVVAALHRRPYAIHRLASEIEQMQPPERRRIGELLSERASAQKALGAGALTPSEVAALSVDFEIAFHTRRHDLLPALEDVELRLALSEGRSEIEALVGHPLTAIAYPHGKADSRVAAAARAAGFVCGYTGRQAIFRLGEDPMLIGRLEPQPGVPPSQFAWSLVKPLVGAIRADNNPPAIGR